MTDYSEMSDEEFDSAMKVCEDLQDEIKNINKDGDVYSRVSLREAAVKLLGNTVNLDQVEKVKALFYEIHNSHAQAAGNDWLAGLEECRKQA